MAQATRSQQSLKRLFSSMERFTQRELAKILRINSSSISHWIHGNTRPEAHHRIRLERDFGIPADDWMTDAEWSVAYGRPAEERDLRPSKRPPPGPDLAKTGTGRDR